MADRSAADKLAIIEQELARLHDEHETLFDSLIDPAIAMWLAEFPPPRTGKKQSAPRVLTAFEMATVLRLDELSPQIRKLEAAAAFLVVRTIDEMGGRASEGLEDPEALLRAALVCMARAWRSGCRDVEHRVTLQAIAAYLRSLDED